MRHKLADEGIAHPGYFHASRDKHSVRARVYEILRRHEFRIDATILEKSKALPHMLIPDESGLYRYAWLHHLNHVAESIVTRDDELYVVAASVGERKKRAAFRVAFEAVVRQTSPTLNHHAAFWDAAAEPCIQVADYCCWAIQRKWEAGDARAFEYIQANIATEHVLWQRVTKHQY